jgi:hypothetical protein
MTDKDQVRSTEEALSLEQTLRLALEALERIDLWLKARYHIGLVGTELEAVAAIKAALEAKDEPVAIADGGVLNWIADKQFTHEAELYKASQRTWVGLTDEERDEVLDIYLTAEGRARAIESKLKEKNSYA